jgi:hypothetical protein
VWATEAAAQKAARSWLHGKVFPVYSDPRRSGMDSFQVLFSSEELDALRESFGLIDTLSGDSETFVAMCRTVKGWPASIRAQIAGANIRWLSLLSM